MQVPTIFLSYIENTGFKALWSSIIVNGNHLLGFEIKKLYRNNKKNYLELNPQYFTYKRCCYILIMPLPMKNIHSNKISKVLE